MAGGVGARPWSTGGTTPSSGALGLSTVAERVETQEQEQFLRDRGCDLAQGYRYSRPLPPPELAQVVREIAAPVVPARRRHQPLDA